MADKIKLTIDGKQIEVDPGTTVLQAAQGLNLDVPHYCYHPGLTIAGNCRICLVEIEKMPKLATSCTTLSADGMVVRTCGPKVEEGRRAVMEFLLANHPLDCPICDQAGECKLQEFSFEHGAGGSRFAEEKIKGFKHQPIGPHVLLDTERCIVCTRCVRFCDEVSRTGELGVFQRGVLSYIGTSPGRDLDNPYSGNTVDICPVGALTLKEFRFKKRVWDLKDVPSVCGSCARGCNVNLGTADNNIQRITPRENPEVNQWWMCDEGRLSYEALHAVPRLTSAQIREKGAVSAVAWPKALDLLASRLKAARPGAVVAIAPASLTLEDLHLLKRLFDEAIESGEIIVPELLRGEDDALLIRADKTPNAAGARLMGLEVDRGNHRRAALMQKALAGGLDVLFLLGDEAMPPADLRAIHGKTFICCFTPFDGAAAAASDLIIPAAAYGEFDGTWVNFQGRAQRVRRGLTPKAIALEGWFMLAEVMKRLGAPAASSSYSPYSSAADVLEEIARQVPGFKALSPQEHGEHGVLGSMGVAL